MECCAGRERNRKVDELVPQIANDYYALITELLSMQLCGLRNTPVIRNATISRS